MVLLKTKQLAFETETLFNQFGIEIGMYQYYYKWDCGWEYLKADDC